MIFNDYVFHRDFNMQYPIITHGEGVKLFDQNGKIFIDGSSGAVAANLGHSNEAIAKAMYEQAVKAGFIHTLRFETDLLFLTSEKIAQLAPNELNKVYFTSGGSEANESAMKLCRQINRDRGKATKFINIGRWQSYHGNTMGSLSVGGDVQRRIPYTPMMTKTEHVEAPYYTPGYTLDDQIKEDERCLQQLRKVIREVGPDNISSVILEPIVGSQQGGVVPSPIYLKTVREICDEFDIYMIIDEVMTGFYRTGTSFAVKHFDIVPDIITFGKGVSAGYAPLAGMIVHDRLIQQLQTYSKGKFIHGFTYSGHPVSLAAGYSALCEYDRQQVEKNVLIQHELIVNRLKQLQEKSNFIADIRGKGLLIGVEFLQNRHTKKYFNPKIQFATKFNELAMEKGAIFYPGSGTVDGTLGEHILIAPPLNITTNEVQQLLAIFEETLLESDKLLV